LSKKLRVLNLEGNYLTKIEFKLTRSEPHMKGIMEKDQKKEYCLEDLNMASNRLTKFPGEEYWAS